VIVNQVGKNKIHHPSGPPDCTKSHHRASKFQEFPGGRCSQTPLYAGALWAIKGLPSASKPSPTLIQPLPEKHFEKAATSTSSH